MTFIDRPLPENLDLKPIATSRKYPGLKPFGPDRPSPGRPKGTVNRVVRDLKEGIIEAAERIGSDGAGKDGLVGFLEDLGRYHKRAFTGLLVKLLPMQVAGTGTNIAPVSINIIGVEHDHYLSPEDIARTQRGEPLETLEYYKPPSEPLPIEPQTPPEQRLAGLEDKLSKMATEQLKALAESMLTNFAELPEDHPRR